MKVEVSTFATPIRFHISSRSRSAARDSRDFTVSPFRALEFDGRASRQFGKRAGRMRSRRRREKGWVDSITSARNRPDDRRISESRADGTVRSISFRGRIVDLWRSLGHAPNLKLEPGDPHTCHISESIAAR